LGKDGSVVMRLAVAGVVLALMAIVGDGAHAQAPPPAALVLEVTGSPSPAVAPYTELSAGSRLSLPGQARIVFLHYQACRTVTATGGTLAVMSTGWRATGGDVKEAAAPCPRKVTVRGGGEVGGVVFRSLSPPLKLATRPAFVLVGRRAGGYAAARILRDGRELGEGPVDDHRFGWPAGLAPLAADGSYELLLLPARAGEAPVKLVFTIAEAPADEQLVLVSVD
jgi:hypothetical protein